MLVRRESIEQAGLLDETFWMYGEDLDWAFRIKQCGWKVYYYPPVVVQHVKRASSSQDSAGAAKARYEFDRAMWLFYRKHYQAATPGWLGQIAMLTGRKIRWDPEKMEIIGDPEAAKLLGRDMRAPYRLG